MVKPAYLLPAVVLLAGCVTERVVERPVPVKLPSICTSDCPVPETVPVTNGDLLVSWRERGEALACYRIRLACVREMTTP